LESTTEELEAALLLELVGEVREAEVDKGLERVDNMGTVIVIGTKNKRGITDQNIALVNSEK
jgi:hypothetical protein